MLQKAFVLLHMKCILIVVAFIGTFDNWLISALKSQRIWYELTVCLRRKVKFFHNSKPNWVENAILPRLHTVRAASGNCQEKKCKDNDAKLNLFNCGHLSVERSNTGQVSHDSFI